MAYPSRLQHWALGRGVWIYTYPGGTPLVSETGAASFSMGGTGDVVGGCGIASGVGCRRRSGGGARVLLCLQRGWLLCAMPFCQQRKPSVWSPLSVSRCLSIAASTFLCPRNPTPRFFSFRTSAWGFLMKNGVSSIAARENISLAIVALFKARRMSDCSSCTRPPCLAIDADMLKPYRRSVAASTYPIRLVSLRYMLP